MLTALKVNDNGEVPYSTRASETSSVSHVTTAVPSVFTAWVNAEMVGAVVSAA